MAANPPQPTKVDLQSVTPGDYEIIPRNNRGDYYFTNHKAVAEADIMDSPSVLSWKDLTSLQKLNHAYYYVISKPYVMKAQINGQDRTVTVPGRFLTDGNSLWTRLKIYSHPEAWIVHDWLYATHQIDDFDAVNEIMLQTLWRAGVRWWPEYYATKLGMVVFKGVFRSAWENSYRRRPQYLVMPKL